MKINQIRPHYSEFIPDQLEDGVLYISERFNTASHKCACGCGEEVVTPLSPVEWQLRKVGDHVSLHPSIGNWNFACHSHYWIRRNEIQWAGSMSNIQIAKVQAKDRADKARYINHINILKEKQNQSSKIQLKDAQDERSWFSNAVDEVIKLFKKLFQ